MDCYLNCEAGMIAGLGRAFLWTLFWLATALLVLARWYYPELSKWYGDLGPVTKGCVITALVLEAVPAFVVGMMITMSMGGLVGQRLGGMVLSLGGLLPGSVAERVGAGVGSLIGIFWGLSAGVLLMEAVVAVAVGGTVWLIREGAAAVGRRWLSEA
jgi:hypothetical protein